MEREALSQLCKPSPALVFRKSPSLSSTLLAQPQTTT